MNVFWCYIVVHFLGLCWTPSIPVTGEDPPDVEDILDTGSSRVADIPLAQLRNA